MRRIIFTKHTTLGRQTLRASNHMWFFLSCALRGGQNDRWALLRAPGAQGAFGYTVFCWLRDRGTLGHCPKPRWGR